MSLRLSSDKITKENLTDGLKEMRKQRTKQRTSLQEVQFGLILRQHFLNSLLNNGTIYSFDLIN
ncbi:hypothetical protein RhiirA1_537598 [Rhizophagus irregularis]|uniref:Uncharacterized protein n=1 Tax=Rhizophagus irregularis TaxID=588596 RepID=A0A2N0RK75_9GLOM|nr:hypothetical protein RhiirA1_537598 [Rhizophagus irregularis]